MSPPHHFMDERLNITILDPGGTHLRMSPRRSNTLREVMAEAKLPQLHNHPFCFFRGNRVHMDLSLACLDVQDGDTITVMFHKDNSKNKMTKNELLNMRMKEVTRLEDEVYRENLRVSDFQYTAYELSKKAPTYYEQIFIHQQKRQEEHYERNTTNIPLVTDIQPKMSEDPLPLCWSNDDLDEIESVIIPQKPKRRRRKK